MATKDHTESVLHTIQALALVIGGGWVAFRYFTHERQAEQMARTQQALTNKRMILLASTQRAGEEAKVRQLQLANNQATMAATIQREQQTLFLEQQRLAVVHAQLTLQTTKSQKDLRQQELATTVRLQELERSKREQEISYAGEYRFERWHKFTHRKLGDLGAGLGKYQLEYSFKFTNRSKTPFDVSFYVLDLYVGQPRTDTTALQVRLLRIPNLRNFTMKPKPDDAIDWRHVSAVGGIYQALNSKYGDVQRPPWSYSPPVDLTLNALGLGTLKHNESTGHSVTYFVTAPHDAYVTAFLAYCFNSCRNQYDGFTAGEHLALAEVEKNHDQPMAEAPASVNIDKP